MCFGEYLPYSIVIVALYKPYHFTSIKYLLLMLVVLSSVFIICHIIRWFWSLGAMPFIQMTLSLIDCNTKLYCFVWCLLFCSAELYSVKLHFTERHFALCHFTECHFTECHFAECHSAECHSASCCGSLYLIGRGQVSLSVEMLARNAQKTFLVLNRFCLLYTSPSPRD